MQTKRDKAALFYKAIAESRGWQAVIALIICMVIGIIMSASYGAASGGTLFSIIVSALLFTGLVIGTHAIGFGRHHMKSKRKRLAVLYYILLLVEISVGISTLVMFEARKQALHENPSYTSTALKLDEAKIEAKAAKSIYVEAEKEKQRGWQSLRSEYFDKKQAQINIEAKLAKIESKMPLSHNAVYERVEAITGWAAANVAFFARSAIVVCSVLIIAGIVAMLGSESASARSETGVTGGDDTKKRKTRRKTDNPTQEKVEQKQDNVIPISNKDKEAELNKFVEACRAGVIDLNSVYRSATDRLDFVNSNAKVKRLLRDALMSGKLAIAGDGNRRRYKLA
jgi:hypothetical protein